MRRTKIVCTIGPSTDSPEMMEKLLLAGMDVARLNFSHGTHQDHAARIVNLRAIAKKHNRPLAILQDLQGPKIRTGKLTDGKPVTLKAGDRFFISMHELVGTAERVSTTYTPLSGDVKPGDRILISDGLIECRVVVSTADEVETEVIFGGELRESQGINLPGVNVSAPALTEKDAEDLAFGMSQDVDYIALSFVRRPADLHDIKQRIAAAGKHIPVIAKIEKPEAFDDIPGILAATDAVMVARGDLGVEVPAEEVPTMQKQLIEACNNAGIPVITATQMLDSMIRNPRPTRAEVSDVANAIIDGTDAVMLSGETANGAFPIESVRMMAQIATAAEASGRHGDQGGQHWRVSQQPTMSKAISAAAVAVVAALPVKAIIAFTASGNTARLVSRLRPSVDILGFTPSETAYNQMALVWGVRPMMMEYVELLDDLSENVSRLLLETGYAERGDQFVMTGGHPISQRGATNFVKVLTVE